MIVAECGVNWNGKFVLATQMIFMAKRCGASLVKFQLFDCQKLARTQEQFDALKPCQLTNEQAESLFQFGQAVGIEVFFSVFDSLRVEWCEKIGVKRYKLAATMADYETIEAVRATNKPVIASTVAGDATMAGDARHLPMSWKFLYCVPEYPTPLRRIQLPHFVDAMVGFSDHTVGLDASMIALARGAEIIEKHFVLDHDEKYPEESFSMSPEELRHLANWEQMCAAVSK